MSTTTAEGRISTGLGPDWSQLEPATDLHMPRGETPTEVTGQVIDANVAETMAHIRAVDDAAFYAERLGSLVARAANP